MVCCIVQGGLASPLWPAPPPVLMEHAERSRHSNHPSRHYQLQHLHLIFFILSH